MVAPYITEGPCTLCKGARLSPTSLSVKIKGYNIADLSRMEVGELLKVIREVDSPEAMSMVAILTERLQHMVDIGLEYLSLNRETDSLSGGESQRVKIVKQLSSSLSDVMYIFDEPSIGLHPRDTSRLVDVLKNLRDLGNTVVVVEHEEDIIKSADYLVDMGPEAGIHGGEVVFAGEYNLIHDEASESLTAKYMSGRMQIPLPSFRRKAKDFIEVKGARQHNLKDINARFPLNTLTVVTGVSGSGKTTLIKCILGMVIPDKAEITVFDEDIKGQWMYRNQIDYLPQIAQFPENLTVNQLLNMIKDIRQQPANDKKLIDIFGLQPFLDKHQPDVLCIQETKAQPEQVEEDMAALYPEYEQYWYSAEKKGYSSTAIFTKHAPEDVINGLPEDIVEKYQGSISAEHGVGIVKKDYLQYTRSEMEISYMKGIKRVFDPNGVMNPGKIFDL